jgi:hypothetical protein
MLASVGNKNRAPQDGDPASIAQEFSEAEKSLVYVFTALFRQAADSGIARHVTSFRVEKQF